jgi:hypothetical protein
MPGLVPGIHVLCSAVMKDVDGRDEPGHDGFNKRLDGDKPICFQIQFSNSHSWTHPRDLAA